MTGHPLPGERRRAEAAPFRLQPSQVAQFERDGYVSGLRILDGAAIWAARAALQGVRDDLPGHAERLYEVESGYLQDPSSVVLHGSGGNQSDHPRRALVFNYMAADTRVADGTKSLLAGAPLLGEGALIRGEHFPIVLDLEAEDP